MSSVGLVHDYLVFLRGAERTFGEIAACWPAAPIYTAGYDEDATEGWFAGRDIRTSYLQRLGLARRSYRTMLPLYPGAFERIRLEPHDTVVSSSYAFAHGIRPTGGAFHVCYCHTPFRYAWHERARALASLPAPARPPLRRTLDRIRRWDVAAAGRVGAYIANAAITAERIGEFYGREAEIVHPPVQVDRFQVDPGVLGVIDEAPLLVVGELVAHKQTEVALEAARLAGVPITVVGAGPELGALERRFPSARFLGRISDEELANLYARARALVIPNAEEFGITAVEAQAAGRPVVALGRGGARETVRDGVTGLLVDRQEPEAFAEAIRSTDFAAFDPAAARANAERFTPSEFRAKLLAAVERLRGAH